jgi:hypothetical protein
MPFTKVLSRFLCHVYDGALYGICGEEADAVSSDSEVEGGAQVGPILAKGSIMRGQPMTVTMLPFP